MRDESSSPFDAPYATPFEHLRDWGVRVALLLRRFIVLHGDRMTGPDGRLDDLNISLNETLAFFDRRLKDLPVYGAAAGRERTVDGVDEGLEAWRLRMTSREAATLASGAALPIEELRFRFGLDDLSTAVLGVLAVLDGDVGLRRVARFAIANTDQQGVPAGFIHELLSPTGEAHEAMWAVWRPEAPLRAFGLVRLDGDADDPPAPLLERPVRLWPRVAQALRGQRVGLDERLEGVVELGLPSEAPETLVIAESTASRLRAAMHVGPDDARAPRIGIWGPPGVGKRALVLSTARDQDAVALLVNGAELFGRRTSAALLLRLVLAESRLLDAPILFDLDLVPADVADRWARLLVNERERMTDHPQPVFFGATRPIAWLAPVLHGLAEVAMDLPSLPRQAALWTAQLAGVAEARDLDCFRLAGTYHLPPGGILRAASDVRREVRLSRRAGDAEAFESIVWRSARRQLTHRLGTLAEPMATDVSWADVVLPGDLRQQIEEILLYARHQHEVFEEWGFGLKIAYGRGLSVLFSGPPGTGKTLVSTVIARELGREIFRIDVSRVVDKYIGETEKNLARIFDEAERAQAVLLFDEADSMFAKRTSVESARDRYANLEVNYLLQRMEAFAGVSVLTTNLETSIDEAFKRRLRFLIRFPEPDVEERILLWKALLPPAVRNRVARDIDWRFIAKTFALTGGYIKNAVIRAAISAASEGELLGERHLVEAAKRVCSEIGRIVQVPDRRRPG